MGVFVNVFLLVPVGYTVSIKLDCVQRQNGVHEPVPFRLGYGGDVSSNSVSNGHRNYLLLSCTGELKSGRLVVNRVLPPDTARGSGATSGACARRRSGARRKLFEQIGELVARELVK